MGFKLLNGILFLCHLFLAEKCSVNYIASPIFDLSVFVREDEMNLLTTDVEHSNKISSAPKVMYDIARELDLVY